MKPDQLDYRSYLLRIWRVGGGPPAWRASLQEVLSGDLVGFTSLEKLFEHLRVETGDTQAIEEGETCPQSESNERSRPRSRS